MVGRHRKFYFLYINYNLLIVLLIPLMLYQYLRKINQFELINLYDRYLLNCFFLMCCRNLCNRMMLFFLFLLFCFLLGNFGNFLSLFLEVFLFLLLLILLFVVLLLGGDSLCNNRLFLLEILNDSLKIHLLNIYLILYLFLYIIQL